MNKDESEREWELKLIPAMWRRFIQILYIKYALGLLHSYWLTWLVLLLLPLLLLNFFVVVIIAIAIDNGAQYTNTYST